MDRPQHTERTYNGFEKVETKHRRSFAVCNLLILNTGFSLSYFYLINLAWPHLLNPSSRDSATNTSLHHNAAHFRQLKGHWRCLDAAGATLQPWKGVHDHSGMLCPSQHCDSTWHSFTAWNRAATSLPATWHTTNDGTSWRGCNSGSPRLSSVSLNWTDSQLNA